jgi:hypothetical protein
MIAKCSRTLSLHAASWSSICWIISSLISMSMRQTKSLDIRIGNGSRASRQSPTKSKYCVVGGRRFEQRSRDGRRRRGHAVWSNGSSYGRLQVVTHAGFRSVWRPLCSGDVPGTP